jgi:protein-tyrosine phosphatase
VSVTAELVEKADVVLVMEPAHTRDLLRRFPHAGPKTFLLGRFLALPVMEIEDPYGGNAQEFTRCYGIIEDACKGFLRHVRQLNSATSPRMLTGLQ